LLKHDAYCWIKQTLHITVEVLGGCFDNSCYLVKFPSILAYRWDSPVIQFKMHG